MSFLLPSPLSQCSSQAVTSIPMPIQTLIDYVTVLLNHHTSSRSTRWNQSPPNVDLDLHHWPGHLHRINEASGGASLAGWYCLFCGKLSIPFAHTFMPAKARVCSVFGQPNTQVVIEDDAALVRWWHKTAQTLHTHTRARGSIELESCISPIKLAFFLGLIICSSAAVINATDLDLLGEQ